MDLDWVKTDFQIIGDNMLSYRAIAETWRVMNKARNRSDLIANNLIAASSNQWPVAYFFYSPISDFRLSDEDFREIYYLLTGAYPSEVEEKPDPLILLSRLSETEMSDMSMLSAYTRIESILKPNIDNETRSKLLHPLFFKLNSRDMKVFLHRLSVRGSPAKRRDIISGLAKANGERFHHIRASVNLTGLKKTAMLLSGGAFEYEAIRPRNGWPLVIPSPTFVEDPASVRFTKCFIEEAEGAWVTIHINDDQCLGFTASGGELPEAPSMLRGWAQAAKIPNGIYLCDYAEMRDNPLWIIDCLTPDDPQESFETRRKWIKERIARWAIKVLGELDDPLSVIELAKKTPVVLRNARGILSYENTSDELVLIRAESKPKILRITGGKIVQLQTGAAPYPVWTVSARDGLGYYPLGDLESNSEATKFIKRHIDSPYKMVEGENIRVDVPCFVEVAVDAAGWGDFGPYISGNIIKGSPTSGISDVIGVEEIGWS